MNSACAVCKCGHPSINHGDYYCDICQSVDGPGCDRFEAAEPAAKPISAEMALRSLDHQRQAHAAAFLGVPAPPVPLVTIVAEPAAKPGDADVLRAQLAEARAERSNIVAYLRHCARVDIGSILSPPSREVVEWCASWIENDLDVKWRAKALSATGDEGEKT